MDDKETSCQGSNLGDFKSVDEVVRFYELPDQKTKTSKHKVNSFSKSVCHSCLMVLVTYLKLLEVGSLFTEVGLVF